MGNDAERQRSNPRLPFVSPIDEKSFLRPSPAKSSQRTIGLNGLLGASKIAQPRLNVITDFSKSGSHSQGGKSSFSAKNSLMARRQMSGKTSKKDRLNLLRSDSKISNLSPSDRMLTIGIDVPNARTIGNANPERHGLLFQPTPTNITAPKTPEIVITPAINQSRWSDSTRHTSMRPASSIYSRPTCVLSQQQFHGALDDTNIPPVPALPMMAEMPRRPKSMIESPLSASSWNPDEEFEDDERPSSAESETPILRSASFDDLANSHRSKGWWNTLLSPLLERSNTTKTICTPTSANERHLSPSFENDRKRRMTVRTSVCSEPDVRFCNDEKKDRMISQWLGDHLNGVAKSPEFVEEGAFGHAAEYYEACFHDANSDTPFFECENHICSYTNDPRLSDSKNPATLPTGLNVPETSASRGLSGADENENGASRNIYRKDSLFSDGSIETPIVHEAKAGTMMRGGSFISQVSKPAPSSDREPSPPPKDSIDDRSRSVSSHRNRSQTRDGSVPASRASSRVRFMERHDSPQPRGLAIDEGTSRAASRSPQPRYNMPLPHAVESPVLTPGMKDDVNHNKAFPMEQTRGIPPTAPMPPASISASNPSPSPQSKAVVPLPPPVFADHAFAGPRVPPQPPASVTASSGGARSLDGGFREMPAQPPHAITINNYASTHSSRAGSFSRSDFDKGFVPQSRSVEASREPSRERSRSRAPADTPKGPGFFAKLKNRLSRKDKRKVLTPEQRRRKRFCLLFTTLLLIIMIVVLALVLALTRHHSDMPVQNAWLNLTNYPPIPTGISTVARPSNKGSNACVQPPTMWSCAVPKEQQAAIAPNKPEEPNFVFEIRFRNGTNMTNSSSFQKREQTYSGSMSARAFIKHKLLQVRDSFTDTLYTPSPAPPDLEEQIFLGKTTDNNSQPYQGELTPFYISFLPNPSTPGSDVALKMLRRDSQDSNGTLPNVTDLIPPPAVSSDGTAAAANLLPLPAAQQLRLYDRGKDSEHYGFYTYFDRSIFLRTPTPDKSDGSTGTPFQIEQVPEDEHGGSTKSAASVRCTWAQTRFLVQIWTNSQHQGVRLLGSDGKPTGTISSGSTSTTASASSTASSTSSSSAQDFAQPGSFPYPITLTIDRHGGAFDKKAVYCYGMDDRQRIVAAEKKFQHENRTVGGVPVNPAQGFFGKLNITFAEGGPGGFDGGSGGCGCTWRNYEFVK